MKSVIIKHLKYTALLILSVVLFSLSFPGLFNKEGIFFISFIALIPMFFVVYKLNYIEALFYGFAFGMGKYLLFNYWLKGFDPAAFAVAPGVHGLYFLGIFTAIVFFYKTFPKKGYIAIAITWIAYEIFKSTNVVGYSYGILGQSMYKTHLFTGIVDIFGTYYLGLIIIFPSILVTFLFSKRNKIVDRKDWLLPSCIYLIILLSSIIYTQVSKVDYSNSKTLRVSLIQHNLNCWLSNNVQSYYQSYGHIEDLSSIAETHSPDLVVWSETAFIPAIEWHKKYRPRNERERYDLILKMEEYLRSTNADYIVGNNESFNPARDKHYNTAYHYKKDQVVNKYRKMNLVPFTEEFPYPELFPWLFNYVKSLGAKQIMRGEKQNLFDIKGVKSTVLICYEDAFSELPRKSIDNGSDLFINITNDAWTPSPSASLQHYAAASLRTIENRRSLVRAGTTGFTAVIDPNGKLLKSLPLFTRDQLTYDVPIYNDHKTFYTKYGHIVDLSGYILFLIALIYALYIKLYVNKKIDKKQ